MSPSSTLMLNIRGIPLSMQPTICLPPSELYDRFAMASFSRRGIQGEHVARHHASLTASGCGESRTSLLMARNQRASRNHIEHYPPNNCLARCRAMVVMTLAADCTCWPASPASPASRELLLAVRVTRCVLACSVGPH